VWLRNKLDFYSEQFFASCPTSELQDHTLSSGRDWLFSTYLEAVSIRNTKRHLAVVTGTYMNINISTRKRNTESLLDSSREVCLEENTEKSKYTTCLYIITRMQDKIMI
jgi:hypothetical protein